MACPGFPPIPTTEARFTILPLRCFNIYLATWRIQLKVPLRFVSTTRQKSSSLIAIKSPSLVIPALFTRISIRPYVFTISFIKTAQASKSATLHWLISASPPAAIISALTASAFSFEPLKFIITNAPFLASSRAIALPIPLEAPVTTAIFFSVFMPYFYSCRLS